MFRLAGLLIITTSAASPFPGPTHSQFVTLNTLSRCAGDDKTSCNAAFGCWWNSTSCVSVTGGKLFVDGVVTSKGFEFFVDDANKKFGTSEKAQIDTAITSALTKTAIDKLGVNAVTVNNKTVETSVPTDAVFTDTHLSLIAGNHITITQEGDNVNIANFGTTELTDEVSKILIVLCNSLGINYKQLKALSDHHGSTTDILYDTRIAVDIDVSDPVYSQVTLTDACQSTGGVDILNSHEPTLIKQTCRCGKLLPGGSNFCLRKNSTHAQKCTIATGGTGTCSEQYFP